MNTEHLVYILEAYKCGSVNKAARNCYISQSHLSTIIKNVEQEIGYPLFHRTANGITAAAWVKVDTQEATPSCSCAIFLMYPGSGATR